VINYILKGENIMNNEILETGHSRETNTVLLMHVSHALEELVREYKTLTNNKFTRDIMLHGSSAEYKTLDSERNELIESNDLDGWCVHADNFYKCLIEQVSPEVGLVLTKLAIGDYGYLPFNNTKMPHHKEFFHRNVQLFKGMTSVD
jgi:hypothetical protein